MVRSSLLVAALVLVTAPAAAHAGGYVSLGVGGTPTVGGDLDRMVNATGHAGRLSVGESFGMLSIEAGLSGYGVSSTAGGAKDGTALDVSVAASLRAKLSGGLGAYGKLGLEKASIPDPTSGSRDSGRGYLMGVGLDYQLDLAIARTSIWLEASRDQLDVSTMSGSVKGNTDQIMLGVKVGL